MDKREEKFLLDLPEHEIIEKLDFIKPEYIKFWLSNKDFRLEYKRLYDFGISGWFYKFFLAAKNVLSDMYWTINPDFDYRTAERSIKMMSAQFRTHDDRLYDRRLLFMLNKLSAPSPLIKYWLSVPEFFHEMQDLVGHGATIDNAVALEAMERIYAKRVAEKDTIQDNENRNYIKTNFSFGRARKAIKSIRKALGLPPPPPANDPESVSVSE